MNFVPFFNYIDTTAKSSSNKRPMIIKLTKSHFDHLNYSLSKQKEFSKLKLSIRKENQLVFIDVDGETANQIRDWIMEKQVQVGFNENYELMPEGKMLEELADAFYTE